MIFLAIACTGVSGWVGVGVAGCELRPGGSVTLARVVLKHITMLM
jgi:hypothetical protein